MKRLYALIFTTLAALGCGVSEAQLPPHQLYGQAPGTSGDCLAIQSVRPSLGFVAADSQVPCTPSFITTVYTNATTSYTPIMSLPLVQASATVRGECTLTWEDSSTSGTVTFAVGLSGAPTDLWVTANPTSGAFVAPTFTTITGTSTTGVTGALATTTANAPYQLHLAFVLKNATAANTLTVYALSNNAAYTASVIAGSSCAWMP